MKPTSEDRKRYIYSLKAQGLDNMEGSNSVIGHLKKIS